MGTKEVPAPPPVHQQGTLLSKANEVPFLAGAPTPGQGALDLGAAGSPAPGAAGDLLRTADAPAVEAAAEAVRAAMLGRDDGDLTGASPEYRLGVMHAQSMQAQGKDPADVLPVPEDIAREGIRRQHPGAGAAEAERLLQRRLELARAA